MLDFIRLHQSLTFLLVVSAVRSLAAIVWLSRLVLSDDREQSGQNGPRATKEAAAVILMSLA